GEVSDVGLLQPRGVLRRKAGTDAKLLPKHWQKRVGGAMESKGDIMMRTILIAGLAAAGIGLTGSSGASAAPVNGAVIGDLATDHVTPVQWGHWRWGSRGYHGRWGGYGYGGHWRWGSYGYGGHWRWGSRGWRRW